MAEDAVSRARRPVVLVAMPFVSALRPSLQLGTLAPEVAARGYPVRTFHFNLDFASLVGLETYEALCDYAGEPWGEWLFSPSAFGDRAPDAAGALLDAHAPSATSMLAATRLTSRAIRRLRDELVPRYLDWLTGLVEWREAAVVGFTSTFQQNVPSLALARRIRAVAPEAVIVFGGANLEGEMGRELLRIAPWVDLAVEGEGDRTLPELLSAVETGLDPLSVPGVVGRRDGEVATARRRPLLADLDELPVPDFSEYFERLRALRLLAGAGESRVVLPFESSRGCWWGQKHHCTFCGLNGNAMRYRAKTPERVEQELHELTARHGRRSLEAVDNILSHDHLRSLVTRLAELDPPLDLFYEVKANLSRQDVQRLAAAGIRAVQPGIESLSTHVLRLMRKGVSAAQNVALLRWCRLYGIDVRWNVLFGFPGEDEADCRRQAELMPLLRHLQPPVFVGRVLMERFSPLHSDREMFPVRRCLPQDALRYVYPEEANLSRLAYLFEYELEGALGDDAFTGIQAAAAEWRAAWQEGPRPWLVAREHRHGVVVDDGREPADPRRIELEGDEARVFRVLIDRARALGALSSDLCVSERQASRALEALYERRLVARDDDRWFAVAVPDAGSAGKEVRV